MLQVPQHIPLSVEAYQETPFFQLSVPLSLCVSTLLFKGSPTDSSCTQGIELSLHLPPWWLCLCSYKMSCGEAALIKCAIISESCNSNVRSSQNRHRALHTAAPFPFLCPYSLAVVPPVSPFHRPCSSSISEWDDVAWWLMGNVTVPSTARPSQEPLQLTAMSWASATGCCCRDLPATALESFRAHTAGPTTSHNVQQKVTSSKPVSLGNVTRAPSPGRRKHGF